jgi:serine phosphatase RsbU (regulator of sigma subunit)
MRCKLQVLAGDDPVREFNLAGDQLLLGRDHHCEIAVVGQRVSRRHARLVVEGDGYTIEDLGSRNHTYVNGEAIDGRVLLRDGDQIKVGDVVLAFRSPLPQTVEHECANILRTLNLSGGAVSGRKTTAEARLRAVLSINRALGRTLDLDTLLPKVLAGLFDVFTQADRALLLLREGDRLIPKSVRHRQGHTESIEYSKTIVRKAMAGQQAILSEDVASDARFPLTRSIQDFQIRSVMCVPLLSPAGDALGVIQVDTRDPRRKFDEDDMQVLAAVASQASVAVEYAQLHKEMVKQARLQKEIDIARDVQHNFLPKSTPDLAGYYFWAYYLAAGKVGGDFYDFLRLPNGKQAVLLGDVSGKGIPAALMMAKASTVCKVALLNHPDSLADAMHAINNEVCDVSVRADFITLAICLIDPSTHEITLGNAGHMSPVFRRADGTIEEPADEEIRGYPLGVERGFHYRTHATRLSPGESALVFSDGISEAMNCRGELYSVERIHRHLAGMSGAGPAELGKTLVEDVRRHLGDCDQNDDISLVVFRRAQRS